MSVLLTKHMSSQKSILECLEASLVNSVLNTLAFMLIMVVCFGASEMARSVELGQSILANETLTGLGKNHNSTGRFMLFGQAVQSHAQIYSTIFWNNKLAQSDFGRGEAPRLWSLMKRS